MKKDKPKTKRELNPEIKRWFGEKRDGAVNWAKDHHDSLVAIKDVAEAITAVGGMGGLAYKVKDVISKKD
jgi:hypothetical protein